MSRRGLPLSAWRGGAIHVGYTRKENGDLAPVMWMAFMARMPLVTVPSGVCSYARHELRLRFENGPQPSAAEGGSARRGGGFMLATRAEKRRSGACGVDGVHTQDAGDDCVQWLVMICTAWS